MEFQYGTRQHWDRVAGVRRPEGTVASDAMVASMLEAVAGVEGRRVLDVGTGNGRLPIELARRGAAAVGIDVTAVGVQLARESARRELGDGEAARRVQFLEMDAARLAFADGAFDAATCLKTIWCLPEPARALAEIRRVLAPGGRLAVQLYARERECPLLLLGPRILGELTDGLSVPKEYRGPFEFTPPLLTGLLEEAGFGEIRFAEDAVEVELASSEEYWQALRAIAGSAYYAYTQLAATQGAAIEEGWRRRAARLRGDDGVVRLGLTWLVCTAVKAGSRP